MEGGFVSKRGARTKVDPVDTSVRMAAYFDGPPAARRIIIPQRQEAQQESQEQKEEEADKSSLADPVAWSAFNKPQTMPLPALEKTAPGSMNPPPQLSKAAGAKDEAAAKDEYGLEAIVKENEAKNGKRPTQANADSIYNYQNNPKGQPMGNRRFDSEQWKAVTAQNTPFKKNHLLEGTQNSFTVSPHQSLGKLQSSYRSLNDKFEKLDPAASEGGAIDQIGPKDKKMHGNSSNDDSQVEQVDPAAILANSKSASPIPMRQRKAAREQQSKKLLLKKIEESKKEEDNEEEKKN